MALIEHKSPTAPARINQTRLAQMHGGFRWAPKDDTFQTDPMSIELILGRVAKILASRSLGLPEQPMIWRSSSDIDHSFTYTEFLEFFMAVDAFMEGKIMESWQKKAAL